MVNKIPPPIKNASDSRKKMEMENMRLKMVACPAVCWVEKRYHIRPQHVRLDRLSNADGDSEC
jgi:Chitin synthase N-terminal